MELKIEVEGPHAFITDEFNVFGGCNCNKVCTDGEYYEMRKTNELMASFNKKNCTITFGKFWYQDPCDKRVWLYDSFAADSEVKE